MSMDHVLDSDGQPFVSEPANFRKFLLSAVQARDEAARKFDLQRVSSPEERASRLSQFTSTPEEFNEKVLEAIDLDMDSLRDPCLLTNFDKEIDLPDVTVCSSSLRSQQLMNVERDKRLNSQYKSVSLRSKKYDNIDSIYLTKQKRQFDNFSKKEEKNEEVETLDDVPLNNTSISDTPFECQAVVNSAEMVWNPNNDSFAATRKGANVTSEVGGAYSGDQKGGTMEVGGASSQVQPHTGVVAGNRECSGQEDVLVTTKIFIGYGRELLRHEKRLGRLLKVTDIVLLSGQNTLLDLKNCIHCPADHAFVGDLSCTQPSADDLCSRLFPSSYFFIHDTFYIDTLPNGSQDISKPIRDWAADNSRASGVGPMKVALMHQTKIIDLMARMGQPYLYNHQGTCEHLICFNDISLSSPYDPRGDFPLRLVEKNFRRNTCAGCKRKEADWSVKDCEILPGTPFFLCEECFREMCFLRNGEKRCPLTATPYINKAAIDDMGLFIKRLRDTMVVKQEEDTA